MVGRIEAKRVCDHGKNEVQTSEGTDETPIDTTCARQLCPFRGCLDLVASPSRTRLQMRTCGFQSDLAELMLLEVSFRRVLSPLLCTFMPKMMVIEKRRKGGIGAEGGGRSCIWFAQGEKERSVTCHTRSCPRWRRRTRHVYDDDGTCGSIVVPILVPYL